MYAYKTAVAVKRLGYRNIKIYNGGIKDWSKAGLAMTSVEALPTHTPNYIDMSDLVALLDQELERGCRDANGKPTLALFDLRNEPIMSENQTEKEASEYSERLLAIATPCPTISFLFDDCMDEAVRKNIPADIPVVTITETGNRDAQVQAFFAKYGYDNILALKFGMRGWIKGMYPVRPAKVP